MMDDLRDYRYYADDLIHPSNLAIQYIWELFGNHFLEKKEDRLRQNIRKVKQAIQHRSFNPTSEAHQKFVASQLKAINKIQNKAPNLNLEPAKNHFLGQLVDS